MTSAGLLKQFMIMTCSVNVLWQLCSVRGWIWMRRRRWHINGYVGGLVGRRFTRGQGAKVINIEYLQNN